ncbi:MAG: hypothetical protein G01um101416_1080 [Microgenomates group bacterium Gr01-1014_16]|nr:MAG: hypothetical protein G01um101416_1080 [Microgenomates group bacterium Gr01-1014_16]
MGSGWVRRKSGGGQEGSGLVIYCWTMSIFEQVKYKLFGVSDFGGELINRPGGEALLLKKGSGGLLVEEGDLKRVEEDECGRGI